MSKKDIEEKKKGISLDDVLDDTALKAYIKWCGIPRWYRR